jgi:PleD family two-component response regulator
VASTRVKGWRAGTVAARTPHSAELPLMAYSSRPQPGHVGGVPTPVGLATGGSVASYQDEMPPGIQARTVRSGARILLAVGDLAQGMMIRRALESDGHEVISARSGRDTVLALIARPADVLLINAPLTDGSAASLVRWTRSRSASAHMTCMVMVPPGDARVVATLYDAGADFVIYRTTELDLLSRKVSAALARRPVALAS